MPRGRNRVMKARFELVLSHELSSATALLVINQPLLARLRRRPSLQRSGPDVSPGRARRSEVGPTSAALGRTKNLREHLFWTSE